MEFSLQCGIFRHPKIAAAGGAAALLYLASIEYAVEWRTDGFVPEGMIKRLADVRGAIRLAQRLVEQHLWEAVEGGFLIHDFLKHQKSKAMLEAERVKQEAIRASDRERKSPKNSERNPAGIHEGATIASNISAAMSDQIDLKTETDQIFQDQAQIRPQGATVPMAASAARSAPVYVEPASATIIQPQLPTANEPPPADSAGNEVVNADNFTKQFAAIVKLEDLTNLTDLSEILRTHREKWTDRILLNQATRYDNWCRDQGIPRTADRLDTFLGHIRVHGRASSQSDVARPQDEDSLVAIAPQQHGALCECFPCLEHHHPIGHDIFCWCVDWRAKQKRGTSRTPLPKRTRIS